VFTDPNLKSYLIDPTRGIDQNNDGEISTQEAASYTGNLFFHSVSNVEGLQYFTSITNLEIYHSPITNLPTLPSSLTSLRLYGTNVSSLPLLPSNLERLNCDSNQIVSLPELPLTLTNLTCRHNNITSLPLLPSGLTLISCGNNQLVSLPSLPSGLEYLDCRNNQLTSLPFLPSSLTSLECNNNQLTSLPVLPPNLGGLYCENNQLTSLPVLPSKLIIISCASNQIKCYPVLPSTLLSLYVDANYGCLPNLPNNYFNLGTDWVNPLTKVVCDLSNSNSCDIFPSVKGRIYIDVNDDKLFTAGVDYEYSNELLKGDYILNTSVGGEFHLSYTELNKNYIIEPVLPAQFVSNPVMHTVNFANFGEVVTDKDFIISATAFDDVKIEMNTTVARPGFDVQYSITVKNTGSVIQDATVQVNFDDKLTYTSSSSQGAVNNSTVTWLAAGLKPFEVRHYSIDFNLPANVTLGTVLNNEATISIVGTDITPINNVESVKIIVQGSYDPNDINVNVGSQLLRTKVQSQEELIYTVRFQNTGTDTAFTVVVRDTLPAELDLNSIKLLSASDNYTFNLKGNVATWTFKKINLPDSTTDKLGSNGFLSYSIKPLSTLQVNDEIKNTAYIYFDFNEAVVTNTVITRIVNVLGVESELKENFQVYPNPSKGLMNVDLKETNSLIQVITTNGEVILEKRANGLTSIDLSGEAKGIYVLKIISSGQTSVRKIIIE
jgi:uncharacterized repeat protein (TIGR01451 family)